MKKKILIRGQFSRFWVLTFSGKKTWMPGTCGTSYVKILLFSLSRTRIFDAHASSQEGKLDETRALQQTAYPREANCSIYLRRVAKNPSQALSRRDIEKRFTRFAARSISEDYEWPNSILLRQPGLSPITISNSPFTTADASLCLHFPFAREGKVFGIFAVDFRECILPSMDCWVGAFQVFCTTSGGYRLRETKECRFECGKSCIFSGWNRTGT